MTRSCISGPGSTRRTRRVFFVHLRIYAAVNAFLVLMWWTTTGPGTYPWFWFITPGWGIGVVGHFVSAFFGQGYVEDAARREYQRLKNQGPQT